MEKGSREFMDLLVREAHAHFHILKEKIYYINIYLYTCICIHLQIHTLICTLCIYNTEIYVHPQASHVVGREVEQRVFRMEEELSEKLASLARLEASLTNEKETQNQFVYFILKNAPPTHSKTLKQK